MSMITFNPKTYQSQVLESVQAYFKACHDFPSASIAFNATSEKLWNKGQQYHALPGFQPDMPYFCLRVPTGGGKTWLAAKSVALINSHLLRSQHSCVLWLVPSDTIKEQTLKALKNREHPYHAALKEAGEIAVLDLEECKGLTRATLDTNTVVIVSTVQAFRREKMAGLKVYESSGALMHHFDNLAQTQKDNLLKDEEGQTTPYSLANVLRLRRPFLIIDEAHNSRTEISFDTFSRFNPSGVMELTATPDLQKTPSNVLHSVGAGELKAEEMIKLPVVLGTEPNWQKCLADAIGKRESLHRLAEQEQREGSSYLRPIVLIQAEPRREGVQTLDVDHVREELMTNHNIPDGEIVIATGENRGLEEIDAKFKLGILDPECKAKYVITQKALAEGWDCPFAYILVSLASQQSSTAVEQLLGRILRQPEASHRAARDLNQSYAFVASRNFAETANALRDRLVASGFNKQEAKDFVAAANLEQARLDYNGGIGRIVITPVEVALEEKPNLSEVDKTIRDKIDWNSKSKTLTINKPLSEDETEQLIKAVSKPQSTQAITQAALASRTTAIEHFMTPAEQGLFVRVPQMALRVQGELLLFNDPEVLDYPWHLSLYDANPSVANLQQLNSSMKIAESGVIDIDQESGKVTSRFIKDLQIDLGLAYQPENWDLIKIGRWICNNLPDPTITHSSKIAFVASWLKNLHEKSGFEVARINIQKFQIRNLIDSHIRELRAAAIQKAYSDLFNDHREKVTVDNECVFEFHPEAYSPTNEYNPTKSIYGQFDFRKHHYGRIGDFDSKEEFECACWLDIQAQKGLIKHWVRNLVRREGSSFFLQKADGRFYPDFVCVLPDETILVVEYKGANGWANAADDRLIGGIWASLSNGKCRFVMVKDKNWSDIEAVL